MEQAMTYLISGTKTMSNRKAFTLVELLTSLVIIMVLMGILLPSIATVRRMVKNAAQKVQFATMDVALEAFKQDYGDYPDSNAFDGTFPSSVRPYCGAMKLCEAMVGRDLKGFNPKSIFRLDGWDATGTVNLYPSNPGVGATGYAAYVDNIKSRKMYLQPEKISIHRLGDIYTYANLSTYPTDKYGPSDPNILVLCDVFTRTMKTGNKTGMPILYYKADTSKFAHGPATNAVNSTYDYYNDVQIVDIPLPWHTLQHPMARGGTTLSGVQAYADKFYEETLDRRTSDRPYNASTYILMSAGADNQYGTSDDIFNNF
jgi:type II secretory pathway pseudopilin PulG